MIWALDTPALSDRDVAISDKGMSLELARFDGHFNLAAKEGDMVQAMAVDQPSNGHGSLALDAARLTLRGSTSYSRLPPRPQASKLEITIRQYQAQPLPGQI